MVFGFGFANCPPLASASLSQRGEPAPRVAVGVADRHTKNGRNTKCFLRAFNVVVGVANHHVNNERNTTCFLGASNVMVGDADHYVKNGRNTTCFFGASDVVGVAAAHHVENERNTLCFLRERRLWIKRIGRSRKIYGFSVGIRYWS